MHGLSECTTTRAAFSATTRINPHREGGVFETQLVNGDPNKAYTYISMRVSENCVLHDDALQPNITIRDEWAFNPIESCLCTCLSIFPYSQVTLDLCSCHAAMVHLCHAFRLWAQLGGGGENLFSLPNL